MIQGKIIQGSTPSLTFDLPIAQDLIKDVRVSFSQKNKLVLVKELEECVPTNEGFSIAVNLTQEDTYLFDENLGPVTVRLRVLAKAGGAAVADEIVLGVENIADKAVMV